MCVEGGCGQGEQGQMLLSLGLLPCYWIEGPYTQGTSAVVPMVGSAWSLVLHVWSRDGSVQWDFEATAVGESTNQCCRCEPGVGFHLSWSFE